MMRRLLAAALSLLSACGDKEPAEDKQRDTQTETEPQDADGDGLVAAEDCDD